jgi:hypothetical protein
MKPMLDWIPRNTVPFWSLAATVRIYFWQLSRTILLWIALRIQPVPPAKAWTSVPLLPQRFLFCCCALRQQNIRIWLQVYNFFRLLGPRTANVAICHCIVACRSAGCNAVAAVLWSRSAAMWRARFVPDATLRIPSSSVESRIVQR